MFLELCIEPQPLLVSYGSAASTGWTDWLSCLLILLSKKCCQFVISLLLRQSSVQLLVFGQVFFLLLMKTMLIPFHTYFSFWNDICTSETKQNPALTNCTLSQYYNKINPRQYLGSYHNNKIALKYLAALSPEILSWRKPWKSPASFSPTANTKQGTHLTQESIILQRQL